MPVPYTRAEYQKEKYQRESVEFDTAGDDAGDAVIVSGEIGEKQDDSKFDIKTLAIVAGIAVILSNFQKLVDGFSAFLDDVALLWDDITQPFNAVRKFFGFGRDSDTQKRDSKRRVAEKDRIYEMEKRALEGSAEWADKKIKRLEEKLDEADDADEREDIEESISRYERKKDRMLGKFKKRWSDRYAGDSGEVEKQDQESRSSLNEKVEGDKAKEERAFRGGVPIGMPTRISAELEGTEGVSQALKDNTEVMSKLTAVLNRKEERVVQSRGKKMQDDIDYNMRKGFNVGLL